MVKLYLFVPLGSTMESEKLASYIFADNINQAIDFYLDKYGFELINEPSDMLIFSEGQVAEAQMRGAKQIEKALYTARKM